METVTYRAVGKSTGGSDADPITTEVIRHGLNSAAEQMKLALIRTAFSPVIYEIYDFGIAIYDRDIRLLAQAPSLPLFMGTMNHCVQASVEEAGGEDALEPGDILLYNVPYGSGSHAQDAAMVMPVFLDGGELVGYTTVKGHWLDIGAIAPYCADTTDVFQEGTMFPGVKIYSRGELVQDIHRTVLTNSRLPKFVAGDINAGVVSLRAGATGLVRLIDRYGKDVFRESVERMFDHGEAIVRKYFENIPDGRYVGEGVMDNNGITDDLVPFEIVVEGRRIDGPLRLHRCAGGERGADQRSDRLDDRGEPGRDQHAGRRGRVTPRGDLPADRGGVPTRIDVPRSRAGAGVSVLQRRVRRYGGHLQRAGEGHAPGGSGL